MSPIPHEELLHNSSYWIEGLGYHFKIDAFNNDIGLWKYRKFDPSLPFDPEPEVIDMEEEKLTSIKSVSRHIDLEKPHLNQMLCRTIQIPPKDEEDDFENLDFEGVCTILGTPEIEETFI